MIKNVAIYLRKSREDEGGTLLNHRKILTQFCDSKGYSYEIYEEVMSGDSYEERTELQKMLTDVEASIYDACVVTEISRLARNGEYSHRIANIFAKHRVKIITPQRQYDLNLIDDKLLFGINSSMSEMELSLTKARLKHGKHEKAKRGEFIGGTPPYGYDVVRDKRVHTLVINEQEATVVREVFDLYEAGHGQREIFRILNARGIPTKKGKKWHQATIKAMIGNEAYLGVLNYTLINNEGIQETHKIENCHEPIITREQFNRVKTKRKHILDAYGGERERGKCYSVLSHLVRCANCGYKMGHKLRKGKYPLITLNKCQNHECCNVDGSPSQGIANWKLEAMFWEEFKWLQKYHNDKFNELLAMPQEDYESKYKKELKLLLAQESKIQSRHNKIMDSYYDGIIDKKEMDRAITRVKEDLEATQLQIQTVKSKLDDILNNNELNNMKSYLDIINKVAEMYDFDSVGKKSKNTLTQDQIEEINRLLKLLILEVRFCRYEEHDFEGRLIDKVQLLIVPMAQNENSPVKVVVGGGI